MFCLYRKMVSMVLPKTCVQQYSCDRMHYHVTETSILLGIQSVLKKSCITDVP